MAGTCVAFDDASGVVLGVRASDKTHLVRFQQDGAWTTCEVPSARCSAVVAATGLPILVDGEPHVARRVTAEAVFLDDRQVLPSSVSCPRAPAMTVVACVSKAATAAWAAAKEAELSDGASLAAAARELKGTKTAQRALDEVEGAFEETLAKKTLETAAQKFSESGEKIKATAQKVASRLAESNLEAAFIATTSESSFVKEVASATARFARQARHDEREALEALEAAVAEAVLAAPPDVVRDVCSAADCYEGALYRRLNNPALGSLEGLKNALDDDQTASVVTDAGKKFAVALKALDNDERAQYFASKLLDDDVFGFIEGLATVDADTAVAHIEEALSVPEKRDEVANRSTKAALDFFLTHLPAMPVRDVDIDKDGVSYSLRNLNLANFQLDPTDVDVDLPFGTIEENFFTEGQLSTAPSDAWLLGLKVRSLSARFDKVEWKFKQQYFPYLEGSGFADVVVEDAAMRVEVAARRRNTDPTFTVSACDVALPSFEVTVESETFGWLLNTLSSVFRDHVRSYVQGALKRFVKTQIRDYLIQPLEPHVPAAWAALARGLGDRLPADPALLPLALRDDDNVVVLCLSEPGPLGLELTVPARGPPDDFRLVTVYEGGQAARTLGKRRLPLRARLIAVDDVDFQGLDQSTAVQLIKRDRRPKTLVFRIETAPSKEVATVAPRDLVRCDTVEMVAASAPNRRVGPLGIRLRPHETVRGAVLVANANAPQLIGRVLVACSQQPKLMSTGETDADAVAATVKNELVDAAKTGRAFAITVADSPDFVYDGPAPEDAVLQAHSGVYVLAALEPVASPLETAGSLIGDVVVAVGDVSLPRNDYADDIANILKPAVQAGPTLNLTLRRGDDEPRVITVDLSNHGRLGVTFTRDASGAPRLKRFDGVPGPLAKSRQWKSKLLHPGLALIAVRVDDDILQPVSPATVTLEELRALVLRASAFVFRDMEAHEALIARFATEASS